MAWTVVLHPAFEPELRALSRDVRNTLGTYTNLLEDDGPALGRPYVDTLRGSRHPNMKEIRFNADRGVWRVAFAFDSRREAVILVAGDKRGRNERQFYQRLIRVADARYDRHLDDLQADRS